MLAGELADRAALFSRPAGGMFIAKPGWFVKYIIPA